MRARPFLSLRGMALCSLRPGWGTGGEDSATSANWPTSAPTARSVLPKASDHIAIVACNG